MAVDAKLKEAIKKKLGISQRHLDRLVSDRANQLMISREQAAIAIAAEAGVSVAKFASADDLAVIRAAKTGVAAPPISAPASVPSPKVAASRPRRSSAPVRKAATVPPAGRKKVFVVHGRDEPRRKSMFQFLRSIGLMPIEWSSAVKATGSASPYIGDVLDAAFKQAVAVVVLLTPDDLAELRPDLVKPKDPDYESKPTGQARPNVLFEAGMAFGRFPKHTVLVQIGDMRPFSDVGGRHVIHLDNSPEQRTELANRLSNAGCAVELGTDWFSEGDFS